MTRRRVHIGPVLLVAAALAAGCAPTTGTSGNSAGQFQGQQRLAAQTIEDLQSAGSNGDQTKICRDILARSLAARLARGGRDCAANVDGVLKDTDSFDMTVQSVQVTGDRATARVKLETGKKDRTATVQLVREGGRWRISGF